MEETVLFQNSTVDPKCNIPTTHLSFIIQFLVPTQAVQENIERLKDMYNKFEKEMNEDFMFVPIGSMVEGYNIPMVIVRSNPCVVEPHSDLDVLMVLSALPVMSVEESETNSTENIKEFTSLNIDTEDTHSGYARVQVLNNDEEHEHLTYLKETKKTYYNIKRIQNMWFPNVEEKQLLLHGPAVRRSAPASLTFEDLDKKEDQMIHEIDFVVAFRCFNWPSVARAWIDRQKRGNWISNSLLQDIEDVGVFLVPVPHKNSLHPDLECRISFALAEVALSLKVITDYQRQCYVFLKVIHYIKLKPLDILTSYHLKTIFLYSCEKLPPNVWKENMGSCLLYMIDCLIECVSRKHLPSFFIPENNLIDYFTEDEMEKVISILRDIRANPVEPILILTDTKLFLMHSVFTPFREIINPVLRDSMNFLIHKDTQKSLTAGFLPAIFRLCFTLMFEEKSDMALEYVKDILPTLSTCLKCGISLNVIINSCIKNFFDDIQLQINYIEKAIRDFDHTYRPLILSGALEGIMRQLLSRKSRKAYKRRLRQYKKQFQTTVEKYVSSAWSLDNGSCLLNQKNFDESAEKLRRCIEVELEFQFQCIENDTSVIGETLKLQKELLENGKNAISSMSMAYYILCQFVLKNNYLPCDPVVDDKIWQYIKQYYEKVKLSMTHTVFEYNNATISKGRSQHSLWVTRNQFANVVFIINEKIVKGIKYMESTLQAENRRNVRRSLFRRFTYGT